MEASTKEAPPRWPKTARIFGDLLAALDITANKLASEISSEADQFSQQVINNYATGHSKPSYDALAAILRRWPALDSKWLLTGKGAPFPSGRYNEKVAEQAPEEAVPVEEVPQPGRLVVSHSLASMTDAQRAAWWQARYEQLQQEVERGANREATLIQLLGKSEASADAAITNEPGAECRILQMPLELPEIKPFRPRPVHRVAIGF